MNQQQVLKGMRLVEAAAFVAGPSGGMALAQMGADVIRIDTIGGGLDYRRWPVTRDGTSLIWCGLNKCKRSVALDLSSDAGREIAMALICSGGDDAGLLLTNFPPRGWLSYETLSQKRADLIQLTVQGDRHGGSAVDYTVNPRVGMPAITGPADTGQWVNHVLPAWDLICGQMVAVGLLAAERHRRRHGVGQHIKLPLEDVALATIGNLGFIAEAQLGQERARYGNELFGAFGRDFTCADGQRIMVVAITQKQWRSLVQAMALGPRMDELAARTGLNLSLEGERFQARHEIAQAVGEWLAQRSLAQAGPLLDQHGVCWGRYQTVSQLVSHDPACSTANPMFSQLAQPGVGTYLAPATALQFSGVPRLPAGPAPLLGQHTEQVLVELLGMSPTQFGRLHDQGVVATAA